MSDTETEVRQRDLLHLMSEKLAKLKAGESVKEVID